MKHFLAKLKKATKEGRKGFSLVELLIAVVVLGILSSMLIAAGTASQNKARMAVAQNDLDSIKNSVYQALMAHPNVMKMKDDTTTFTNIINYLNSELDDAWRLDFVGGGTDQDGNPVASTAGSGLIAQTATQKDPWGNPYGVYVYTNDHHTKYTDESGQHLGSNDSCMYIVVTSAGRNATGGPMGQNGDNYDSTTGKILASNKAVNNSDGIDDLGVIIRIKNGTLLTASFGTEQCTLGTMAGYQWIYGEYGTNGGIYVNFNDSNNPTSISEAGSIDKYMDQNSLVQGTSADSAKIKTVGKW